LAENQDGEKLSKKLYDEAQEALVASLLASRKDNSEVFEILSPDDFAEPKFEKIYTAALELSRQSEKVDAFAVANYLETRGELATVDGLQGLQQLTTIGKSRGMEAPIKVLARILRETSAKRQVKQTLDEFTTKFQGDSGQTAADGLSELQSVLNDQLYRLSNESTLAEISDVSNSYRDLLEERKRISEENAEIGDGLQGIPTSLPSLNRYTTGWKAGQMITVAAETGVGKSVFAINSAVAAMQAGKSVLFFSLEMSVEEINDRIVASVSSIPMNDLKQGILEDSNQRILDESIADLSKAKLTIDFDAKQTIDGIRAKALKKAQSEEGLDFIVIDYLQLITPTGRFSSRQEAVADISRNMKLLAKQLGVPIMVLAQMNRSKDESSEDGMPKLSGIRESGAIAQDSDVVILLHRNKSSDEDIPPTYVILAKQRNGEADKIVKCHSHLECSMFQEIIINREFQSYSEDEVAAMSDEIEEDLEELDDLGMDDWDEFE
jgi:replicative DNA helicase